MKRTAFRGDEPKSTDAGERYPPESRVDLPRIERAVREILVAEGENPDREGLRDTPARVAGAYEFLFAGPPNN